MNYKNNYNLRKQFVQYIIKKIGGTYDKDVSSIWD